MFGKIVVAGIMLTLLGIALTLCSMPIFSFTRQETHTLPPAQKSATIMDYSFVLGASSQTAVKDVAVQMEPSQTLSITARNNMPSQPQHAFDFSIAIHQPDGIDAVYFSRKDTVSFTATWSPTISGQYHLMFSSGWSNYAGGMDIYAKVVKTWTAADTNTVTVTETKSLIDTQFSVIGLGMIILGVITSMFALSFLHKYRR